MTKYIGIVREHFHNEDYPVFTLNDVKVTLNGRGISPRYLKLLINKLIGNGEIRRITRGVYTFHEDMAVIGFAFRPFYYGLEDALSYRNLWTQAANPAIMTTNGVREGPRKFGEMNYMVKRVKPEHFFGFDFIKHYDMWLPVSDANKTLIDLVYYKHGIRKDDLGPLLGAINSDTMAEYLKPYSKSIKRKICDLIESTEAQQELHGVQTVRVSV